MKTQIFFTSQFGADRFNATLSFFRHSLLLLMHGLQCFTNVLTPHTKEKGLCSFPVLYCLLQ